MSSSWDRTKTLDEATTLLARGRAPRYVDEGGVCVLNQKCVRDQRIDLGLARRHDDASRPLDERTLRVGDVLVNSTGVGTLGRVAPVRQLSETTVADSHLTILRPDPELFHPAFFGYAVIALQPAIEGLAEGSTGQTELSRERLGGLSVSYPDLNEQRAVASVLCALDDKIESNRSLIEILQAAIAALFERHCRDHPSGASAPVSEIARFVNGKAFTKHAGEQGRPILRIKELQGGVGAATPVADLDVKSDHVAKFDDLLFSWSGTLVVTRWPGEEALINQHLFKVIPNGLPTWFVEGWVRHHLPEFQAIARDKATTMGHIRRRDLDEATVIVPPPDELEAIDHRIAPLDRLRAGLASESQRLTDARDALLPKLVSGKLRVQDTEAAIEETTAA